MAQTPHPPIGVIGLGAMGAGMARNLLAHGFPVVAHDLRPEAVAALVADGASGADSPRDVAARADTVIVIVQNAAQMREAIFGAAGLAGALRPGGIVIVSATIAPDDARQLGEELDAAGFVYLDAPVSGGQAGAEAGTLAVIVGATPEAFAAARPVFDAIGAQVYHVGPVGSGQAAKMCHQVLACVGALATMEAFALADAAGVEPRLLYEIATHGAGDSWMLRTVGAQLLAGSDRHLGRSGLLAKDLGIIIDSAERLGLALPVTRAARQHADDAQR